MGERNVRFDARAARDVRATVEWYIEQRSDLGAQFVDDLDVCVERIAAYPELCRLVDDLGARRALLGRFPFALYYRLEDDEVVILGVVHMSRRPEFWRGGLEE